MEKKIEGIIKSSELASVDKDLLISIISKEGASLVEDVLLLDWTADKVEKESPQSRYNHAYEEWNKKINNAHLTFQLLKLCYQVIGEEISNLIVNFPSLASNFITKITNQDYNTLFDPQMEEFDTLIQRCHHEIAITESLNRDLHQSIQGKQIFVDDSVRRDFIRYYSLAALLKIKRRQSLEQMSYRISNKFEESSSALKDMMSQKFLIRMLIHNSEKDVGYRIVNLLSLYWNFPLVMRQIENGSYMFNSMSSFSIKDYPAMLSISLGKVKGKTYLLNQLFGTTFSELDRSFFSIGTADAQIVRAYKMPFLLIDVQQYIPPEFENALIKYCSSVILQIDSNNIQLNELSEKLKQLKGKQITIFLRDYIKSEFNRVDSFIDQNSLLQFIKVDSFLGNIFAFPPIQHIVGANIPKLERIYSCFKDRTMKSFQLKPFCEPPKISLFEENEESRRIYFICNSLLLKVSDISSNISDVTPMYCLYKEMCKLKEDMNNAPNQNEIDAIKSNLERCIQSQKELSINPDNCIIMKIFRELISIKNSNLYMLLFCNILKEASNKRCSAYLPKKEQIRKTKYDMPKTKLSEMKELDKELKLIDEQIVANSISLEILWREYLSLCEHNSKIDEIYYSNYILNGNPFEIVDGDNSYFPYDILKKVLSHEECNPDKKLIVVSIFGPESSGKSTLLNALFGCQFQISAGRCTKGIYGTLLKDFSSDSHVMLLDTEGILSVIKNDPTYDRKIALFCLAVSNVVIINLNGEIKQNIVDLIIVCSKVLIELGSARIPSPFIEIVLNQLSDPNKDNQTVAFTKLLEGISSQFISSGKSVNEILGITSESINILPNAFANDKVVAGEASRNYTDNFIEQCNTLYKKICHHIENIKSNRSPKPLIQWLDTAQNIYSQIEKFRDLTRYDSAKARTEEAEVRNKISVYVQIFNGKVNSFLNGNIENKTAFEESFEKQLENNCRENSKIIYETYDREINEGDYLETVKKNMKEEMDTLIKGSIESVTFKYQQIYDSYTATLAKEEKLDSFVSRAYNKLDEKVYTEEEVNKMFDDEWQRLLKSFKRFGAKDEEKIRKQAYNLYQNAIVTIATYSMVFTNYFIYDITANIVLNKDSFLYSSSDVNTNYKNDKKCSMYLDMGNDNVIFERYIEYLKWRAMSRLQLCINQFKSQGKNPKLYMEYTIIALKTAGLSLTNEADAKLKNYIYDPLVEGIYQPASADIYVADRKQLYQCLSSQEDFKPVIEKENAAFADPRNRNDMNCEVILRIEFGGDEVANSIKDIIKLFSHYCQLNMYNELQYKLSIVLKNVEATLSAEGLTKLKQFTDVKNGKKTSNIMLSFTQNSFTSLKYYNKINATHYISMNKNKRVQFSLTADMAAVKENVYFKLKIFNKLSESEINEAKLIANSRLNMALFTKDIRERINKSLHEDLVEFVPKIGHYTRELAQELSGQLNQLGFSLCYEGYGRIHQFAIIYTVKSLINNAKAREIELTESIKGLEPKYRAKYLGILLENKTTHEQAINEYLEDLFSKVWNDYNVVINTSFVDYINSIWNDSLSPGKIEELTENKIFAEGSAAVAIEYISDPIKILKSEFAAQYNALGRNFQILYKENIEKMINGFELMVKKLNELQNSMLISQLLYSNIIIEDLSKRTEENKKIALYELVKEYLIAKSNEKLTTFYSERFKSNFIITSFEIRSLDELPQIIISNINKIEYSKKILSLPTFLQMFINSIGKFIITIPTKARPIIEYINAHQSNFLSKSIGCETLCPICRKKCQVEGIHPIHRCNKGHYMRGINGVYIKISKKPSFLVCSQVNDKIDVEVHGKLYSWSEIKEKYKDSWDFSAAEENKEEMTKKLEDIWMKVGHQICANYKMDYTAFSTTSNISYSFDILFNVDCTGSMGSYISQVKSTLTSMVNKFSKLTSNLKFGFVGYRDHKDQGWGNWGSVCKYKPDLLNQKEIISFINELDADGGGDCHEAIVDSMDIIATKIRWNADAIKYVFHICDAPPHGSEFGNQGDEYPQGCPCGLKYEPIYKVFNGKQIKFVVMKIGNNLDSMIEKFKSNLALFEVKTLESAIDLDEKVIECIENDIFQSAVSKK